MDESIAAERLSELHQWQAFYNMIPREDSQLTKRFVNGEISWPVDVVARELMATDYIYRATLYGEMLEGYMRKLADRLRSHHPELTWSQTWTIVRFYGPISLKLLMLLTCNASIPQRLD